MEQIANMISNQGFPIVLTLLLLWYTYDSTNKHKEEMEKMSEALNNNTIALTKLLERMEGEKNV